MYCVQIYEVFDLLGLSFVCNIFKPFSELFEGNTVYAATIIIARLLFEKTLYFRGKKYPKAFTKFSVLNYRAIL